MYQTVFVTSLICIGNFTNPYIYFNLVPTGASSILPSAQALNSTSMEVKWNTPAHPNGIILHHKVYIYKPLSDYKKPILISTAMGGIYITVVNNLTPYTLYQFTVKTCNSMGCTQHSYKATAKTLEASPSGQGIPTGKYNSSNAISLNWKVPSSLNGPISSIGYIVERRMPSFSYPPPHVTRGVHFPGFGYYQFHSSLMPDSAISVIQFQFRTRYAGGLIFFAASQQQQDMVAVELRDGYPWFIFDTESGAVAFTVQTDMKFNDNNWHNILITRHRREGKIIVDNKYTGMGSVVGDKNIIGQITSVFIGGLPNDFKIIRKDDGRATLKQVNFIGCLKEFKLKSEIIDFKTAVNKSNNSPLTDHCPNSYENGTYFKGGGYIILKKNVFNGSPTFTLKFRLKTSDNASLIFLSKSENTLFAVYLKNGYLVFQYKTPTNEGIYPGSSALLCDGSWHNITIESSGYVVSSYIGNNLEATSSLPADFFTSISYIGGIPLDANKNNILRYLEVRNAFHGCLQNLVINTLLYFPHVVDTYHNIDFDGCPQKASLSCNNGEVISIYNGTNLKLTDSEVNTYTEYLYRVKSYRKEIFGFGVSPWLSIRSGEGGKFLILC